MLPRGIRCGSGWGDAKGRPLSVGLGLLGPSRDGSNRLSPLTNLYTVRRRTASVCIFVAALRAREFQNFVGLTARTTRVKHRVLEDGGFVWSTTETLPDLPTSAAHSSWI